MLVKNSVEQHRLFKKKKATSTLPTCTLSPARARSTLLLLAMSQMPLGCVEASAGRVCGRACQAPCVGHTGYWALCSQQVWTVPMPGTGACRPLHCSPLYVLRYGVLLLVLEHTLPCCFQRQCLLAQLLVTAEKGCPFHGTQCARLCSRSESRQCRAGSALGPWGPRPAAQRHQESSREGHPCSWHCTQGGKEGVYPRLFMKLLATREAV